MLVQRRKPLSCKRQGLRSRAFGATAVAVVATSCCGQAALGNAWLSPGRYASSVPSWQPGQRIAFRLPPRQAAAASADSGAWSGADSASQGRLRALGRLLRTAGESLVAAAAATAAVAGASSAGLTSNPFTTASSSDARKETDSFDSCNCATQPELLLCGIALRGAAEALLGEQWIEAEQLLGCLPSSCSELFPKEHLEVLQMLLAWAAARPAEATMPDARKALAALSQALESASDTFDQALQNFLLDAAAALRSAARIFTPPKPAFEASYIASNFDQSNQRFSPQSEIRAIEQAVASVPSGQRRTLLRELARKYHPDRNPGREMEVLPAFLHVQRLREELGRWAV